MCAEQNAATNGQWRGRWAVRQDGQLAVGSRRHHQKLGVADRIELGRLERQVARRDQRAAKNPQDIEIVIVAVVVREEADGTGAGEEGVADIVQRDGPLEVDPLGIDVQSAVGEARGREAGDSRTLPDDADVARIQVDRGAADIRDARAIRRQQIGARIDRHLITAAVRNVDGGEASRQQAGACRQQQEISPAGDQRQSAG